ncbi:hypothetical protein CBM2609_A140332 [Cupriavidus taiwanensis]|uniref:Uncharacterized protein n=1 Tax=Cupriavidus taiwanensis TaxID=164546 RepID=A0A976G1Y9_9BURK|nr:hypothetical protein CBM2604_A120332 [Cupriavidus taiwanensis]SOZ25607.1 hypothetical protein CBM2609_A140332 [Cupriavidus taiwanensis]SOZ44857.1 hypothetical protein CBM2610_A150331 [Cupriavidus taiwanensis]SOZ55937.1 hypothetical protein CBM2615_A280363 [Cupriavidus taiwanensis]SOZ57376.1 hypothetical protein CBM2614_A250367 [Cupriavidus taiwanensis]
MHSTVLAKLEGSLPQALLRSHIAEVAATAMQLNLAHAVTSGDRMQPFPSPLQKQTHIFADFVCCYDPIAPTTVGTHALACQAGHPSIAKGEGYIDFRTYLRWRPDHARRDGHCRRCHKHHRQSCHGTCRGHDSLSPVQGRFPYPRGQRNYHCAPGRNARTNTG